MKISEREREKKKLKEKKLEKNQRRQTRNVNDYKAIFKKVTEYLYLLRYLRKPKEAKDLAKMWSRTVASSSGCTFKINSK